MTNDGCLSRLEALAKRGKNGWMTEKMFGYLLAIVILMTKFGVDFSVAMASEEDEESAYVAFVKSTKFNLCIYGFLIFVYLIMAIREYRKQR